MIDPIADCQVILARGIQPIITDIREIDQAVSTYLAGNLVDYKIALTWKQEQSVKKIAPAAGAICSANVFDEGEIYKMPFHRFARFVWGLDDQDEHCPFVGGVAPEMRQGCFENQEVALFHEI